ncbi:MAG: ribbon-helix-helix domain-containing protein [Devosia sp.]|jgi:predicted transcriptional regulator|nr:ribbon-helix-helix domain-containing protein [Devosia sp.]
MADRIVSAHLPEELAEKIDRHAKLLGRSKTWIVEQALSRWLSREDEKKALLQPSPTPHKE